MQALSAPSCDVDKTQSGSQHRSVNKNASGRLDVADTVPNMAITTQHEAVKGAFPNEDRSDISPAYQVVDTAK
jgi:hypothetical protein